jgi:hypothetical protein
MALALIKYGWETGGPVVRSDVYDHLRSVIDEGSAFYLQF